MHVQERQFRRFSGVFVTPHWRTLFVPIIVKRRLQMIKEFDNYIHLNQALMLNYGARYGSGLRIPSSPAESTANALVDR